MKQSHHHNPQHLSFSSDAANPVMTFINLLVMSGIFLLKRGLNAYFAEGTFVDIDQWQSWHLFAVVEVIWSIYQLEINHQNAEWTL